MAIKKPVVMNSGTLGNIQPGDTLDPTTTVPSLSLTNADAATAIFGAPVYSFGAGTFKRAQANNTTTTRAIGLIAATAGVAAGVAGTVVTSGPLSATTALWDAVTGQSGGLTPGATYFVDAVNLGKITTAVPSDPISPATAFVQPIGRAIDTTILNVQIGTTVQL